MSIPPPVARLRQLGTRPEFSCPWVPSLESEGVGWDRSEWISWLGAQPLVVVGDFHPHAGVKNWLFDVLAALALSGHRPVLGLELIEHRFQAHIDTYLRGGSSEAELESKLGLEATWGFDWLPFRGLLRLAKFAGLRVVGLDDRTLTGVQRDRRLAAQIRQGLAQEPQESLICLIGENHLQPNRLPQEWHRLRSDVELQRVLIDVQEKTGPIREPGTFWRVGPDLSVAFSESPLGKSRAAQPDLDGTMEFEFEDLLSELCDCLDVPEPELDEWHLFFGERAAWQRWCLARKPEQAWATPLGTMVTLGPRALFLPRRDPLSLIGAGFLVLLGASARSMTRAQVILAEELGRVLASPAIYPSHWLHRFRNPAPYLNVGPGLEPLEMAHSLARDLVDGRLPWSALGELLSAQEFDPERWRQGQPSFSFPA